MSTHPDNPRLPRTPIRVSPEQEVLLQDLLKVTTVAANLANERRKNDHKNGRKITPKGGIERLDRVANFLSLGNAASGDFFLRDLLLTEEGRCLICGVVKYADKRSFDGWNKHLTSNRPRTEYKRNGKNKRIKWFQQPRNKRRDSIQIPAKFVQFSGDYCEIAGIGRVGICRTDCDWAQPGAIDFVTIDRDGVYGWCLSVWQRGAFWGTEKSADYPHDDDYYLCDFIAVDMGVKVMAACHDGTNSWTVPLPDCSEEDRCIALCRERLCATSRDSRKHQKFAVRLERAMARKQRKLDAAQHQFVHDILKRRPRYIVLETIDISDLAARNDGAFRSGWCKAQSNGWRRLLDEKGLAAHNGIEVIRAKQKFASTKLCPNPYCGHWEPMTVDDRWYECPECGASQDRDEAAAVSLYHYGLLQVRQELTEGYAPSYAKWRNGGS